jgi:hypothetical protein
VQAAQHHVGGDTPTNCLGNLASDVLPLGIGKVAKLGAAGVKGLTKGAKFGAKTAKEAEELEKARRKAAELIRQRKKATLKNELKQTAKDATTEVITTGAITAALAMNPPPEDYEPPAEEEEFDEKSAEQPPPPNTMAVAVGAIAFVAIVWLAYDKI